MEGTKHGLISGTFWFPSSNVFGWCNLRGRGLFSPWGISRAPSIRATLWSKDFQNDHDLGEETSSRMLLSPVRNLHHRTKPNEQNTPSGVAGRGGRDGGRALLGQSSVIDDKPKAAKPSRFLPQPTRNYSARPRFPPRRCSPRASPGEAEVIRAAPRLIYHQSGFGHIAAPRKQSGADIRMSIERRALTSARRACVT